MLSIVQFYSTLQRVTRSSKCERPQRMESCARASNYSYRYIDSHRHIHAPLLPEQSGYAFVHRHEDACKCSQEASVAQSVCDHVRHWLCPGILLPTQYDGENEFEEMQSTAKAETGGSTPKDSIAVPRPRPFMVKVPQGNKVQGSDGGQSRLLWLCFGYQEPILCIRLGVHRQASVVRCPTVKPKH